MPGKVLKSSESSLINADIVNFAQNNYEIKNCEKDNSAIEEADYNLILKSLKPYELSASVINLDALARNYQRVRQSVATGVIAAAVVKANSYGFGAVQISGRLYQEGCRNFFVASAGEGLEIRKFLPTDAKIFLLAGILKGCEEVCWHNNLTPVLNSLDEVNLWIDFSKKIGQKLSAGIQVDTGMVRNGISMAEAEKNCTKILENIDVAFVMSHLACSDELNHYKNKEQLDRYKKIMDIFNNCAKSMSYARIKGSLSATNGIFLGSEYHFDIVRPGKALYGFSIRKDLIGTFEPVMNVFARITQINEISEGETIGYGATYQASRPMRTATLGIGYADGFMRKFEGFGHAFVGKRKVPVVGRMSMDYIVVDITDVWGAPELQVGEWLPLTQSPDHTLEKWALEMDTLPHEVCCRFGRRVKKVYVE